MKKRQAKIERKTNETDITVEINVDGIGESSLSTGMPFLNICSSKLQSMVVLI
ncbi:MAG: hypothetical protein CM15mP93_04570 [Thiotrichaceae bacterium]|nr:MAG: hypothetical protein CM15mP93_04570 [Thiotrichaceae bacterium]